MSFETKAGVKVLSCDDCDVEWVQGTPKPTDFRILKRGKDVKVLCTRCAPQPIDLNNADY